MNYPYITTDEVNDLLNELSKSEHYQVTLVQLFLFSILFIFIFYFIVLKITSRVINNDNVVTMKVCCDDSMFDIENDLDLTYNSYSNYIEKKYSINLKDKPNSILIEADKLLTQVSKTASNLQLFTHAVDIRPNNKKEIRKTVREAGNLIIYVDNEINIINKALSELLHIDSSYNEEYKAIIKIRNNFKKKEKKIITLCLMLISIVDDED